MRFTCFTPILLVVVSGFVQGLDAADWPQFRGPERTGATAEKHWQPWPAGGPKIAWKARVGLGFSSIVIANGRAATAGFASNRDTVFCFDAVTGKQLWKHSYPAQLGDVYYDGGTSGTPTFDGDRLYWLSRWGDLFCFNAADGKIVWSKQIQKETGMKIPSWGFTGAPLVHDNLLVLNIGEAGMALDKSDGTIMWQSANGDCGYSTPLPVQRNGQWLALLSNDEHYLAVELKTGREVWRHRWLTQYGVNAADPIVSGDRVFICSGYGKGGALLDVSSGTPQELWKTKKLRTQFNSAVLHEGHLYGPDGDTTQTASLKCLEFATGEEKWAHPGFGSGGVLLADGQLIALTAKGELLIAPASPDGFKPVARAQVLGGTCWTAPVMANGMIYCRSGRGDVVAVDVRK
jgi:outer membrane protein assembly factor BamB